MDMSEQQVPQNANNPNEKGQSAVPNELSESLNRLTIQSSPKQPASPTTPGVSRLQRKSSSPLISRSDTRSDFRRASSHHSTTQSPSRHVSAEPPKPEDKPPATAASVASTYFKQDLATSEQRSASSTPRTTVVLQDSCYGHRFSRPKTSKSLLNLIVERPERLRASVLGVAASYVRSGGRHTGSDNPPGLAPSSAKPPFKIHRTSRALSVTHPTVAAVHGAKWMQELKDMCEAVELRLATGQKELLRPETSAASSSQQEKQPLHEGDLYLSRESLDAFQGALGGMLDGVDAVFQESECRRAFVCIRPPGHHCSSDHPSGFCWLNNVHVGIEHAAQTYGLTHAAIIDFDLHHGDGSQAITWDRNQKALKTTKPTAKNIGTSTKKPFIGYFSIHDVNSYPCEDGDMQKVTNASVCIDNAHGQSIWNIHLQPWKTLDEFWQLYETRYLVLLDKARQFLRLHSIRVQASSPQIRPKAAIFLSAGFDASEWEMQTMQRHKVNVPTEFYARFTKDVVKLAEEQDLAVDGRVVSVLEGGYSDRALMSGVLSHLTGLTTSTTATVSDPATPPSEATHAFDNSWWSSSTLAELELLLKPPAPIAPPKKLPRTVEPPTYATPTQSFTAKAVDPAKVYRSISGANVQTPPKSRPPTPPPPDVDWATAAHELSKILIPKDRPTHSCKHEELNEPRAKKDRHSSVGLPSMEGNRTQRMQLRGRKAPTEEANTLIEESESTKEARDQSNRRRTISDLASISGEMPLQSIERPTTSGSDTVMRPPSQAKITPVPRQASKSRRSSVSSNGLNVNKTRRSSMGKPNMPKTTETERPPIPKSEVGTKGSDDVDKLTTGVKKITLRLPNNNTSTAKSTSEAASKLRRAAVPKEPKSSTAQPAITRTSKTAKPSVDPPKKPTAVNADIQRSSTQAGSVDKIAPEPATQRQPKLTVDGLSTKSVDKATGAVDAGDLTTGPGGPDYGPDIVKVTNSGTLDDGHAVPLPTTTTQESGGRDAPEDNTASMRERTSAANKVQHTTTQDAQFVQYRPLGHDVHRGHGQQEALKWLPPNTGTPEQATQKAGRNKENLPVFSANGPIPFAPGKPKAEPISIAKQSDTVVKHDQVAAEDVKKEETAKSNVWDVPETPAHKVT
ncbi:MAG: hypothetical protein M1828_005966 [Chrysothrix sp. TS-e1954]|nr:MAG: hypothetical protein M1828_005966 [Chrysothrix sp. TS-e1954]